MPNTENLNNTAGEAGQNTNTFNADTFADTILSAIERKNAKNETSIINSNFAKLSDEEKELAYAAYNEKKERAARKEKDAFDKMQKERDDAIAKLNAYEQAETQKTITNEIKNILSELDVTDEKNVNYALKLIGDQSETVNEGTIDKEKLKANIITVVNDMPFLKSKKEVKPGAGKPDDKKTNEDAQWAKWMKAVGLSE